MKSNYAIFALLTGLLLFCVSNANAQQRQIDDVLNILAKATAKHPEAANVFKSRSYAENVAVLRPSSTMIEQLGGNKQMAMTSGSEAFYVYSPGNNEGFVVVSADERMSPILAYTDKGDFDLANMPDNVKAWFLGYVAEAKSLSERIVPVAEKASEAVVGAEPTIVGPLLTTEWGQSFPYNAQCPMYSGQNQAVTGCVATAMAQAMNYYKHPERGVGSNSYVSLSYNLSLSKDFNLFTPQWNELKSTYLSVGNTDAEVEAIASLMYNCGVAVNMDYGPESGSSQPAQMTALYKYFGYDKDMHIVQKDHTSLDDWHLLVQGELEGSRPVMLSGSTPSGYAHAFILDGYTTDEGDYPYYHVNWGWNGLYNGNYKMSCMSDKGDPNDAYTEGLSAIIGFKPENNITEIDNYIEISNIDVASEDVDISQGEPFVISFDKCINGSLLPFTGKVVICLVNDENESFPVYTMNFSNMLTNYFSRQQDVECSVPSALPSGKYTIQAFAINQGSSTMVPITIGTKPDFVTITNDPNVFLTSIEATNIEATKTSSRALKVDATGICNFSETAFSGTLQMIISDYNRKFVSAFGTTRSINNLGYYNYYSNTFSFTGTLPSNIADGAYRLNLGANQNGYTNWSPVKRFVMEDGYITSQGYDATTRFWVMDNEITFTAPFKAGDVNSDETVSVPDLSALIRLVLDNYTTQDKTFWAADLNDDARLNVGDYSLLVDKILNSGVSSKSYAASPRFGGEKFIDLQLTEQDGEYLLAVKLVNGQQRFNSMQFDLLLPNGLELAEGGVVMTPRTRGFRSAVRNGRVLLYNLTDSDISGEDGDVVYLRLNRMGSGVKGTIGMSNIVLSESEACEAVSVSDAIVASMPDDLTGVNVASTTDGVTILSAKGSMTICADKATTLHLYSVDGAFAKIITLQANEKQTLTLPAGAYLVGDTKVIVM